MNTDIEQLLWQSGREPDQALRGRVLQAVQAELRQDAARRWWHSLPAAAAAAALWIHLTWSAALNLRLEAPLPSSPELSQTTQQIRALLPDLPADEAQRMALRLNVGASRSRWVVVPRGRHT